MYGYIYLILNKENGKTYIGQHKSSKLYNEDNYIGSGSIISKAFEKYGKSNFEKFLLEYVKTKEDANKREIFWIAYYRKLGKAEYNIAKGGENAFAGWNKGKKMSEDFCRKNSESHKGQKWNGHLPIHNKPHSSETKSKISASMKGNKNNPKGYHWKLVDGKRIRFY